MSSTFTVVESYGPRAQECIDHAITMARVTGSVGATHSIGGDGQEESKAVVDRDQAYCADCGGMEDKVFTDCCEGRKIQCRTATETDINGDVLVTVCKRGHGCDTGLRAYV